MLDAHPGPAGLTRLARRLHDHPRGRAGTARRRPRRAAHGRNGVPPRRIAPRRTAPRRRCRFRRGARAGRRALAGRTRSGPRAHRRPRAVGGRMGSGRRVRRCPRGRRAGTPRVHTDPPDRGPGRVPRGPGGVRRIVPRRALGEPPAHGVGAPPRNPGRPAARAPAARVVGDAQPHRGPGLGRKRRPRSRRARLCRGRALGGDRRGVRGDPPVAGHRPRGGLCRVHDRPGRGRMGPRLASPGRGDRGVRDGPGDRPAPHRRVLCGARLSRFGGRRDRDRSTTGPASTRGTGGRRAAAVSPRIRARHRVRRRRRAALPHGRPLPGLDAPGDRRRRAHDAVRPRHGMAGRENRRVLVHAAGRAPRRSRTRTRRHGRRGHTAVPDRRHARS